MNINFTRHNKYSDISFRAHKKDVRDADDIMRRAKNEFPLTSSTKMDTFWDTKKNVSPKQQKTINGLQNRICALRRSSEKKQEMLRYLSNPYMPYLEEMKQKKIGNCYESAVSAIAGLRANGYPADLAYLFIEHSFVDKKTKKVVFSKEFDYDHVFTVTDMGKKDLKTEKKIILDPWLGYCGTWQEIGAKYKHLWMEDEDYVLFLYNSENEFAEELKNGNSKVSDFEEKITSGYRIIPSGDLKDKKIQHQLRKKFPALIVKA